MEYNSEKSELILPEYGRNVQLLINHAKTIENDDIRQAFIEKIIVLMHQMNPQNRTIEDYREKLWGHVYHIAQYDINLRPFNGVIPKKENAFVKPDQVPYPHNDTKYRHYGHNVQTLIDKALEMEEGPKREAFVNVIGSYMKLAYKTWNREHYVSDEIIKNDLTSLSGGKLFVQDGTFLDNLGGGGRDRDRDSGYKRRSSNSNSRDNRRGGRDNNKRSNSGKSRHKRK